VTICTCSALVDNRVVRPDDVESDEEQHGKWCKHDVMYVQACITHFLSCIESTKGAGEMMYPYDRYVFIHVVTRVSWLLG
jgi:hypothetical protein